MVAVCNIEKAVFKVEIAIRNIAFVDFNVGFAGFTF